MMCCEYSPVQGRWIKADTDHSYLKDYFEAEEKKKINLMQSKVTKLEAQGR